MGTLIYTWNKEHCGLYKEIHGTINVFSCQIELFTKDKPSPNHYQTKAVLQFCNKNKIGTSLKSRTWNLSAHSVSKISFHYTWCSWEVSKIFNIQSLFVFFLAHAKHHYPQIYYCEKINRLKNDVNGLPSRLLACMLGSDHKVTLVAIQSNHNQKRRWCRSNYINS